MNYLFADNRITRHESLDTAVDALCAAQDAAVASHRADCTETPSTMGIYDADTGRWHCLTAVRSDCDGGEPDVGAPSAPQIDAMRRAVYAAVKADEPADDDDD